MSVKIIIERRFKEGTFIDAFNAINNIRTKAMSTQGYISGETLVSSDDPREVIVISHWASLKHWEEWFAGEERSTLEDEIAPLLAEPVKFRIFNLGSDALFEAAEKHIQESW